ncbi:TPD1 protein homolog 1-like [Magnolia sinica]|uniref:TPD1 protein homolog 1-like n=1 Tax=Magnolia sinica TaxID=86752 RepID=UPI00265993E3|nr:TPD1 protein homolog 1-like [Magnolia sinica]
MASISLSVSPILTALCFLFFFVFFLHHPTSGSSGNAPHVTRNRKWMRFGSADIGFKPCKASDIVVSQAAGSPLPDGIPTFSVQISSTCSSKCPIWGVHVSCGLFASAKLVNPRIFRRVGPGDCIVNDGKPLESGVSLSFIYANSFSYPMYVSRANIC